MNRGHAGAAAAMLVIRHIISHHLALFVLRGRFSDRPEDGVREDALVAGGLPDRRFVAKRNRGYGRSP